MLKILKRGGALLFAIFMLTGCTSKPPEADDAAENQLSNTERTENQLPDAEQTENQHITINVAEMHVAEHPITKSLMYFAQQVEEDTEGRVQVDVCPAGLLGSDNTIINKVRSGKVDIARVSSITMSEYSDNLIPFALPYIFRDREHMWQVMHSELGDEMLSKVDGCQALAWIEEGTRCFYSNEPIYSPDDMVGKRFRVPNSQTMYSMLHYYGAVPITLDFSDVYDNMQKGYISGAENDIISYDYFASCVVAKYFVENNHSYAPGILVASDELREKVGDDDYEIICRAAKAAQEESIKIWAEAEAEIAEDLEENNVQIIVPTKENMDKFREAADYIYKNYQQYDEVIQQIQNIK